MQMKLRQIDKQGFKFHDQQGFKQCFLVIFVFQICLRLILVSGKTHEFLFSPSDTAYFITQHVYENWPEGLLLVLCKCSLSCLPV